MWMMGYNEGAQDSLSTNRKLRPLIPRLSSAANTTSDHRFNIVATMAVDQNKRELMMMNSEIQNHPPLVVSSRWNPTPDQLRVLEDLYRQGTRTPSAEQIQQITSQLKRYGKIEGKNVFYWFQNHKARERQKRRRQMETEQQQQQYNQEESVITTTNHGFDKKDSPDYKVEQTKNWICSVGCDTQPEKVHDDEESISITMVAAAANKWAEINGAHRQRGNTNATWHHMMHLPPGLYPSPHHHLILNSSTVSSNISTTNVSSAKDTATDDLQSLVTNREIGQRHGQRQNDHQESDEDCSKNQDQTLELFPLRKEGFCNNGGDYEKEKESEIHCFYEFLPLKN